LVGFFLGGTCGGGLVVGFGGRAWGGGGGGGLESLNDARGYAGEA
jgi:hypothetical protein